MSREIKFRAWTHQNPPRQWFQKNVAITGNGEQMVPIGGTYTSTWHALRGNNEGLIIEQYTGLKDKNGKEIYEGDIVKQLVYVLEGKEYITTWVVRWDKTECCFELHYLSGSLFGDSMMSDGDEYEVIGNIHENPELLNPCNSTDLEPSGGEE